MIIRDDLNRFFVLSFLVANVLYETRIKLVFDVKICVEFKIKLPGWIRALQLRDLDVPAPFEVHVAAAAAAVVAAVDVEAEGERGGVAAVLANVHVNCFHVKKIIV